MFIDTHTHLYLPEFAEDTPDSSDVVGINAVKRAFDAGIGHLVMPNVDLTTINPMKRLHDAFPKQTSMAMGLHPTEVHDDWRDTLAQVEEIFRDGTPYVAVGEIGIDLYWDRTYCDEQMQVFERQVAWATEASLPVIIHCREGLDQTLEVLQSFPTARGVMHSFGGSVADVERVQRVVDFYFGINGIVTFKNSHLREVLPAISLNRLLLETDSPYLAPVPHRGRRNESAYIVHTAAHIADALGMNVKEIADATTANAISLFSLDIE